MVGVMTSVPLQQWPTQRLRDLHNFCRSITAKPMKMAFWRRKPDCEVNYEESPSLFAKENATGSEPNGRIIAKRPQKQLFDFGS
ncbi:hypothetical protein HmCmsJML010_01872 [Escherichia coli]|jgi:hypothetical protein|nr:hypothetical protein HMPREF1306_05188 [Klebsiella pneumoniae subsp. pneumoniae WGLW2]VVY68382.1 Uncharacterised protein [Escherichia coli]VVY74139.1 Uncharacterised protein [Escherichia coli]VVY74196.1 Uncharacterised protein [Escherichia coli]VVY74352.1 Uncharacterised protein [Escherichia coli]